MDTPIVVELMRHFKQQYGLRITSAEDLLEMEKNLLEFLVNIGRALQQKSFEELGSGYEGPVTEKDGQRYLFKGHREKSLHGLFGTVSYRRAYYVREEVGGGGYTPLDERLGLQKRHTPGCSYFFTLFSGHDTYQESLTRFHEIFRPDGRQRLSLRKALDMDYSLGDRLERLRQQEIEQVFAGEAPPVLERPMTATMAVSIDAGKVREKLGEVLTPEGRKRYEIGFKDAKVACISEVVQDARAGQARCQATSYVIASEHADEFFRRIWVEMNRRCAEVERIRLVFLGDGAEWIWNRVGELANEDSVQVLDFYHASEHLSTVCKGLYGEQGEAYRQQFTRLRDAFWEGKVGEVIGELKRIRDGCTGERRQVLQDEIKYFEDNKDRMRYDRYRAMGLPIGSGTVESACKNVVGGRMKQGGMTWSEAGAKGMFQIRASLKSNRFYSDFQKTLKLAA